MLKVKIAGSSSILILRRYGSAEVDGVGAEVVDGFTDEVDGI